MKTNSPRDKRYPSDCEARLFLRPACPGQPPLAGPGKGLLINISRSGAAVEVGAVRFGKWHLVYSPQADRSQLLSLEVGKIALATRPVWFHRLEQGYPASYRVGVEFVTPPSPEQWGQLLARKASKRTWPWERLFAKRPPGRGLFD